MNEQLNESFSKDDELFAKYLDGELTPKEKLRLDEFLSSTPNAEHHIAEMSMLERELRSTGTLLKNDNHIILEAGDRLRTALFQPNSTASNVNIFSKISTWLTGFIVVSSVAVFWVMNHTSHILQENTSRPPQHQTAESAQIQTNVLREQQSLSKSEPAASHNYSQTENKIRSNDKTPRTDNPLPSPSGGTLFLTDAPLSRQIAEKISRLEKEEEKYKTSGDTIGYIQALFSMAALHHTVKNSEKSLEYYNQCLNLSIAVHATEMQARSLGESALIYEEQHNRSEALRRLEQCIQLLRATNSKKVTQWETVLAKLKNE